MHSSLLAPSPNYEPTGVVLWNTGKNLRVDFNPGTPAPPWKGNFIVLDGVRYDLVELHFHRPAEHAFDTMSPAPVMEVHLVHADSRGNLAVVGLPIALGATTTPALEPLLKAIPRGPGDRALLPAAYNAGPLIPNRAVTAYRYPGSLTTPPYAECVRWTVLWHTLYISQTHFAAYKERFPGQYYRDTQPLNGRVLLRMSTRP
jgi:carbonic anhydrase